MFLEEAISDVVKFSVIMNSIRRCWNLLAKVYVANSWFWRIHEMIKDLLVKILQLCKKLRVIIGNCNKCYIIIWGHNISFLLRFEQGKEFHAIHLHLLFVTKPILDPNRNIGQRSTSVWVKQVQFSDWGEIKRLIKSLPKRNWALDPQPLSPSLLLRGKLGGKVASVLIYVWPLAPMNSQTRKRIGVK